MRLAKGDARQPFDLSLGSMYRLRLVQMNDFEYDFTSLFITSFSMAIHFIGFFFRSSRFYTALLSVKSR